MLDVLGGDGVGDFSSAGLSERRGLFEDVLEVRLPFALHFFVSALFVFSIGELMLRFFRRLHSLLQLVLLLLLPVPLPFELAPLP